MRFYTVIILYLASIVAGLPTQKQCGLANASCHADCNELHSNLKICLCGTAAEQVNLSCKDSAKAYIECAKKKCTRPVQRQSEIDNDTKRYIIVKGNSKDDFEIVRRLEKNDAAKRYIIIGGELPGDHDVVRRSDKYGAAKRYIIIQGDSPDDFEIV